VIAKTLPQPQPATSWTFPPTQAVTIGNGLRIVSCALPDRPLIDFQLSLHSPIGAEPPGLDGIRAVLGAAFARGPAKRAVDRVPGNVPVLPASRLTVRLDAHGIRLHVDATADEAKAAMELLSRTVRYPDLGCDDGIRLVWHARHSGRLLMANRLDRRASAELYLSLFGASHRLGRPLAGTPTTLARIDASKLRDFHTSQAHPGNAVLTVTGELPAGYLAFADAAYRGWSRGAPSPTAADPVERVPVHRLRCVERPEYQQVQISVGARLPGPGSHSWPALTAALFTLGGSQMPLIDLVLREQHGYTFGMRAWAQPVPGGAVAIITGLIAAPRVAAACAELLSILDRVRTTGFTARERDQTIRSLCAAAPRNLQGSCAVGDAITEGILLRQADDYAAAFHAALSKVSRFDMRRAVARYLAPDRLAFVVSGPGERLPKVAAVIEAAG
jgi:predicted Zn-dependent peptidase